MATYTSNYAWTKPGGNDQVDIGVLNGNLDSQDAIMHKAFTNMAPPFSGLSTYAVGDVVLYDNVTYKCHTAVTVAGAWTGSTNWQVYKLSEGGGGSSLTAGDYIDITAGVISVKKEKGDYSLERYVLQSTGGGAPKLVVKKYIDSELISTNEYANNTAHVNIDNTLEIWYSYNPYNWHYKLLVDGVDHSAGYEYEFSYTDTTEYPVDFHIAAGDSTDLVTKSDLTADNVMMSDGVTSVEDVLDANPLSHNGIYTGRNLGTINSASDWAAFRVKYGIADKSYKGLYLGDYVKVNDGTYNADWMVAGFNTETNKGSTNIPGECVSMIPRVGNGCGTSYMNSTNVTTGGYKDSYMNTTKLPDVATKLTTIFGSNLVTREILVSKTVTNGYASDWEWISCKCSLLTSVQVYGSLSFENTGGTYYAGFNIGEGCEKLPVFNFIHPVQFARSHFWLRGVTSASNFCGVAGNGSAAGDGASVALGVRPLICLN